MSCVLHAIGVFYLSHQILPQRCALGIVVSRIVLTGSVGELKVRNGQPGEVFLHIKRRIFRIETAQQHQSQRQGADDKSRPPFVPAKIGPGHPAKGCTAPPFCRLLRPVRRIAGPQGLNGRHFSGKPGRAQAGDENRDPGKQGRAHKNHRTYRYHTLPFHHAKQNRNQKEPKPPAKNQPQGDADKTEAVCLSVD